MPRRQSSSAPVVSVPVISGINAILAECKTNSYPAFSKRQGYKKFLVDIGLGQRSLGSVDETAESAAAFALCVGLVNADITLDLPQYAEVVDSALKLVPLAP
eukprot:CAMPEP_0113677876 /NCGR_PEP_ID=MMETSP0038_2-20120614/9559_1 /TAXON_ID=2898 /ORGANISM="Cryptomonas paramecium" /LENGTH=101 /DNA_ID=CAMNT_0000595299 /DNA_START=1523 /DNA_END=1825 /DNA_ORIENTATION=- /assembly_acc=CAM_ASM_000170